MSDKAILQLEGKQIELPIIVGTENEKAVDITRLRAETGFITLDSGYANTGSCKSEIAYIDGEKGILRYRGYPIEELARHSNFIEVAYLLIFGEMPTVAQRNLFSEKLTDNAMIHESLKHHFDGFPTTAHPMAILSAMINALSCFHADLASPNDPQDVLEVAARMISKVRTIAAYTYKMIKGQPFIYPDPKRRYVSNLLHMMFSVPHQEYEVLPEVATAIDLMLMLHADHEQNCSTSTVRMVASSGANLFASVAAGICALWGRLHGGANMEVLDMLEQIHKGGYTIKKCVEMAKDKTSSFRLMGFGHRVYKSYDPRARILKDAADKIFKRLDHKDPLLDIALELEQAALQDSYFKERNLYPNVDFYSGMIMRAIGIPTNMFTVFFAIGRLPGWIANWREVRQGEQKIARPRQIYTGKTERFITPVIQRG